MPSNTIEITPVQEKHWSHYFDASSAFNEAFKNWNKTNATAIHRGNASNPHHYLSEFLEHCKGELPSHDLLQSYVESKATSVKASTLGDRLNRIKRYLRHLAEQQPPNKKGIVGEWRAQILHAAAFHFDSSVPTPHELNPKQEQEIEILSSDLVPIKQKQHEHDYNWLLYFSPRKAMQQVAAHIATLGSTGSTDNTKIIYNRGLRYFFEWCNADENFAHPFPDTELITQYIAHLSYEKNGTGVSARTIASKYMAPLRLYISKLRLQRIETGDPMQIITYKNHLDESLAIKNPKSKKETHQAALYAHGNRLTKSQVDKIFESFDLSTLKGMRDYALMYTAFTVALRLSELQRLTLADIRQTENGYETTVKGKRNNQDPVFMDARSVQLIRAWVAAYNAPFYADDTRRITDETPIWQPLRRGGRRKENHRLSDGMHADGIAYIVRSTSKKVLGFRISPHDCRRSYAAIARIEGIEMDAIQTQLRHKSIATTQTYIGPLVDRSKASLSSRVTFAEPIRNLPLEIGA